MSDPIISALSFFRSVIRSGEPWTDHCEKAYDEALAERKVLKEKISDLEADLAALRQE